MKDKQILFIIHRLYFNNLAKKGGVDRILEFLAQKNKVATIEHPFEKINHPSVFTSKNIIYQHHSFFKIPFVWIEEFIVNIIWVLKNHVRYDLAIASDPLNFFSSYSLKKLGLTKKIQFHSTDYSFSRFNNSFLEAVYQFLYHFSLKQADYVTVTSQRMLKHAYEKTPLNLHRKIFLLPNSPYFNKIPKIQSEKKKTNQLVILSGIFENQVDINNLLFFLKLIKKQRPNITLNIIGHLENNSIQAFIRHGLKQNVCFYGHLPYEQAIEKMAQCYMGITSYKKSHSYMYYADSLKIREYAAAGLPIVCDNMYGTAEEVQKYDAGVVYNTAQEMATAVDQLMSNKKLYQIKSENALSWAKKMDKGKLLTELYRKLL